MHKIIYSCEEATRLTLKKEDSKVTLLQKIRLRLHLMVCGACERFNIQNKWIDEQLHKLQEQTPDVKLSDLQKEKLAHSLSKEFNHSNISDDRRNV